MPGAQSASCHEEALAASEFASGFALEQRHLPGVLFQHVLHEAERLRIGTQAAARPLQHSPSPRRPNLTWILPSAWVYSSSARRILESAAGSIQGASSAGVTQGPAPPRTAATAVCTAWISPGPGTRRKKQSKMSQG